MNQTQRRDTSETPQRAPAPRPGLTATPPVAGQVHLIAGADVQDLPLAGRTVAEARVVARAVFGTRDDAQALADGHEVGEDYVLDIGQRIEFTRRSGQKGAASPVIEVAGDRATWRRNGNGAAGIALRDLLARIEGAGQAPERWRLHPRHVRLMAERRQGRVVGVVIEMPPAPRRVAWISDDSPEPFGEGTRFVEYTLSFPWLVLLIVFVDGELCGIQQAFYRTEPIGSLADPISYTNLLNVARGYGLESWLCLANLTRRLGRLSWDERIRRVEEHVWQAAYTRSSEFHEGSSFWQTSARIDRRLATASAWDAATLENPYFTLQVRWRAAPQPLGATLARMLDMVAPWRPVERAEQLLTLLQQDEES